jgi:ferrous iron transport protein B
MVIANKPLRIALVGNPNCGKTTLFNVLTQKQFKVGNWPGVTVEKHVSICKIGALELELIDLPGIYSLAANDNGDGNAIDEKIAVEFLQTKEYDLLVNVVDASNLCRNLYLTSQLLEINIPMLLVANMQDVADSQNIELDLAKLARLLRIPALTISAKKNNADIILKSAIIAALNIKQRNPIKLYQDKPLLQETIMRLANNSEESYWASVQLLEKNDIKLLVPANLEDMAQVEEIYGEETDMLIIGERLKFVQDVSDQVVMQKKNPASLSWQKILDKVLLNKLLGLPILFLIMSAVFAFSIFCSSALAEEIASLVNLTLFSLPIKLINYFMPISYSLESYLKVITEGASMVAQFIPAIAGLYIALGILEDSGYMMRAAFLLDKLMCKIGLPGKAFIPIVLGFGCNVPAIMATRCLGKEHERLITIMMLPFMSCSARLATYTLFVSAFFPENSWIILFSLYLFGIIIGILTAFSIYKAFGIKNDDRLILHLPDYKLPNLYDIFKRASGHVKKFISKAGTFIFATFIIFQFISAFAVQIKYEKKLHNYVTAIFQPMGIEKENWPAVAGIISGTFAKEMIIGTLGGLYLKDGNDSQQELPAVIQSKFPNKAAVIAYLIFILLYFPCISVFATIAKELNYKWAFASAIWSTTIAYISAVIFYQLSLLLN